MEGWSCRDWGGGERKTEKEKVREGERGADTGTQTKKNTHILSPRRRRRRRKNTSGNDTTHLNEIRFVCVTVDALSCVDEFALEQVSSPLDGVLDGVRVVLEGAQGDGSLWGVRRAAVALRQVWHDHLRKRERERRMRARDRE